MTIKQILDLARIEAGADNNDVKDETLLQILNENIKVWWIFCCFNS